jgi:hypothetical protein
VVAAASVNVAILLVASSATVPAGFVQGAAHVTVKLALPVRGTIGSLKAAVMMVLLIATPVALLTGATAVTVGGVGGVGAGSTILPPMPRIGACPSLPPPHPAVKALSSNAINHGRTLKYLLKLFIFFPYYLIQKTIHAIDRPHRRVPAFPTSAFERSFNAECYSSLQEILCGSARKRNDLCLRRSPIPDWLVNHVKHCAPHNHFLYAGFAFTTLLSTSIALVNGSGRRLLRN